MNEARLGRIGTGNPLEEWMKTSQLHPETGEPFTAWINFETENPAEFVHYYATEPQPPAATVVESIGVDEDGEDIEQERERTPEEMAAALAAYQEAHAKWVADGRKTGMQSARIATGPKQIRVEFVTETGATAIGLRLGDTESQGEDWHWMSWKA